MPAPLKILIASHACANFLNQRLFALAAEQRDWRVTMVIPSRWKNEYGKRLEAQLLPGFKADLIQAPMFMNGSVPLHAYLMNASKLLRRVQPDVVYSHNEPYALSTIQWCRANASTGEKPFGFFSCQNLVKKYPPPFRQGEAMVYRKSSFFFPITDAVDQVHRQKGYAGKSTVIPLGFDSEMYNATLNIGQRHTNASKTFQLAFVGRIVEEKGLVTLARALQKVSDLDWKFIIVGAGPFEDNVRAELESCGVADRVEWRGFVPQAEVAKFFESVDALILPSESRPNWTEQFGRVLIESMACGTPVIGSDSGEIPTIIRQTSGGLVFKEADVESCASAIRTMILDKKGRAHMAGAGHEFVHKHYSLTAVAGQFADMIESAALRG